MQTGKFRSHNPPMPSIKPHTTHDKRDVLSGSVDGWWSLYMTFETENVCQSLGWCQVNQLWGANECKIELIFTQIGNLLTSIPTTFPRIFHLFKVVNEREKLNFLNHTKSMRKKNFLREKFSRDIFPFSSASLLIKKLQVKLWNFTEPKLCHVFLTKNTRFVFFSCHQRLKDLKTAENNNNKL